MAFPIIKLSKEEHDLFSNGGILLEKVKGADGLKLSYMDSVTVKFGSVSEIGKIETITVKEKINSKKESKKSDLSDLWTYYEEEEDKYHNVAKLVLIARGKKVNIASK